MTGPQLQAIRRRLGAAAIPFGRAIGLKGKNTSVASALRRLESLSRVPDRFALTAALYDKFPAAWAWATTELVPSLARPSPTARATERAEDDLGIDPFV